MTTYITGASVWEQDLYDRLVAHLHSEKDVIEEYERLAEATASPGFRYVAGLILEDERRHHRLIADLAAAVKAFAELRDEDSPIPALDLGWRPPEDERQELLEATERFLAIEREDERELKELHRELRSVRDTTLWDVVVEMMKADTQKHVALLKFVRERLRHPII